MSIGAPFPENTQQATKIPKNIVQEALKVKDYLSNHPASTQISAGYEFRVSRARISQLIKIVDNLPCDFITELSQTKDINLIRRFSGKRLLKIASLESENTRREAIKLLR